MSTWKEYYIEFKSRLESYSDDELIQVFNGQVRIRAFGIARSAHLKAIRDEFDQREFDYSAIGDDTMMSYAHKVQLKNKTIVIDE